MNGAIIAIARIGLNKAKGHRKPEEPCVLDPYDIEDDWFEIILPSLQLTVTEHCPSELRSRAEYTLIKLNLRDHEQMIRIRQEWYELYQNREITLGGLRKKAPLIARAVEKQLASET